jgi:GT2 family glycosyltransferase
MSQTGKIGIVVVSYRNNPELVAFLQHLAGFASDQISYTVAVANGLDEAEATTLLTETAELMPGRLHVIAGSQNPGYFGGAALGWQEMRKAGHTPDWIIVTNDDIRCAPDFFETLCRIPARQIAVLAPDIKVPSSGLHQNPYYISKPPRRRLLLIRWLHRHSSIMRGFLFLRGFRQRWRKRQISPLPARRQIYAPHGSCMIFSRPYFDRGGSLEYPCFLYGEEFFVAETAKRLNLIVQMEPSLKVTHHEHATTGLLPPASMAGHIHTSLGFLLREYYQD